MSAARTEHEHQRSERPEPPGGARPLERVTAFAYRAGGLEPDGTEVPAFRIECAGLLWFFLPKTCDAPTPKGELHTAGGTVFVVSRVVTCAALVCGGAKCGQ